MNRTARRKANAQTSPQIWCNQGLAALRAGNAAEAERCYRAALKLQAQHPDALQLLGLLLYQTGRHAQGARLLEQSVALQAAQPHVWFNLAMMREQQGQRPEALEALEAVLQHAPDHAQAMAQRAGILAAMRRYSDAAAQWERLAVQTGEAEALRNAALCYKESGDYAAAFVLLEAALAQQPAAGVLQLCMASLYREVGQADKARAHYRLAIAADAGDAAAHYHLALVTRYDVGDAHLAQMEALIGGAKEPLYLHFALGKAYEDCGDLAQAFAHYDAGNALKRAQITYHSEQTTEYFDKLKTVFDSAVVGKTQADGPVPIFIVGMPRSGSSLVEQVLASHSQVSGAGELDTLSALLQAEKGWPEVAVQWDTAKWQSLGQRYLSMLREHGDVAFICDKMPMNFHFIGAIRRMLPEAKILHVQRHPMATCLSIYKRLFFGPQPFAYDMGELGEHYRAYADLMDFWRARHGDAILDVSYEALVREGEPQMRRLLDFCGLSWEADCARFYETRRAVTTASATQVRQPLYQDAIDSWRASAPYSGELLRALQLDLTHE